MHSRNHMLLVAAAATLLCATVLAQTLPSSGRPVLAIVTTPLIDCATPPPYLGDDVAPTSCLSASYVRWAEAAGVRVVPLHWNSSFDIIDGLLRQVNGVLFPGGDLDAYPDVYNEFFAQAQYIYKYATSANARTPNSLVVTGHCQGFQVLCAVAAGTLNVIENNAFTGTESRLMPLDFTAAQPTSQLLGNATTPATILSYLAKYNTTLNMHHDGVPPEAFAADSLLGAAFTPLSTNVADNGRVFVSTMESKTQPFYAVQWHPEWPPFDFSDDRIVHTSEVSDVSQYMAATLRNYLLRSPQRFDSPIELEELVVENHLMTYAKWGKQRYWIGIPADRNCGLQTPAPTNQTTPYDNDGGLNNVGAGFIGAAVATVVVVCGMWFFVKRPNRGGADYHAVH